MLKSEKEVAQAQLQSEKAVIKEIEKQYKQALDEIDEKIASLLGRNDSDMQNVIYQVQYQKQLKTQVQSILEQLQANEFETISEFLAQSYQDGFVGAMYSMHSQDVPLIIPIDQNAVIRAVQTESKLSHDLYTALGVDITKLKKTVTSEITRGIATGMLYDEIARSVSLVSKAPMSRAKTIVRTEAHRIQQASAHDAYVLAKSKGADVVKQWDSTLDGDTRPTHRQLDGQIVELEESFKVAGKSARYPGDFGDPAEDCNCRCRVNQRAKWALGKDELQTLKDRAEYFGLDKSDSFKEFEKKYIKSAETLENVTKSSIIESENSVKNIGLQFFATMPVDKFTAYALNPVRAPDKAKAFKDALGYTMDNYEDLMKNIDDHVDESKFVEKGDKGYGMRYEFVLELEGPNGKKANVLTAWIQDGEDKRLTSVYVTDKKVTE